MYRLGQNIEYIRGLWLYSSPVGINLGFGDIEKVIKNLLCYFTGVNIAGIEMLALSASITEPSVMINSSMVSTSAVTTASGISKSLNFTSPMREFKKDLSFCP